MREQSLATCFPQGGLLELTSFEDNADREDVVPSRNGSAWVSCESQILGIPASGI
jgi:hypothetical protein